MQLNAFVFRNMSLDSGRRGWFCFVERFGLRRFKRLEGQKIYAQDWNTRLESGAKCTRQTSDCFRGWYLSYDQFLVFCRDDIATDYLFSGLDWAIQDQLFSR